MPYFRCRRCTVRLYSAASETRCSECGALLGRAERLLDATPLAQPHRVRVSATARAQPLPADGGGPR